MTVSRGVTPSTKLIIAAAAGLLVGAAGGMAIGLVSADQRPDGPNAQSAQPSIGSQVVPAEMQGYMDEVNKVQPSVNGQVVATVGARPTLVANEGKLQYMTANDVAKTSAAKGRYSLTLYCAGKGTLWVALRIGPASIYHDAGCGEQAQPTAIHVDVAEPLAEAEQIVTVVPAGPAVAAFSYTVTRTDL